MKYFDAAKKEGKVAKAQRPRLAEGCLSDANTLNIAALESALNRKAVEIGLTMGRVTVKPITQTPCVSAGIAPQGWGIEMSVNPDFSSLSGKDVQRYLLKKEADPAPLTECHDVLCHEAGHWKYCPTDKGKHEELFLEPIGAALKKAGKDPTAAVGEKSMADYVANIVEDIIDNTGCRKNESDMAGQMLFWKEQGLAAENGKYGKLYEAFVSLNLHLWGGADDKKLISKHFAGNTAAVNAANSIISELGLKSGLKSADFMLDESNWARISETMARHLAPLIDPSQPMQLFGTGEGQQGKPDTDSAVLQRYKAGKGAPSYMKTYDSLASLYRQLAREIPVKASSLAKSSSLPFAHMRHREFDPENDEPESIDLSRLGIGGSGALSFMVPQSSLSLPYEVKHGMESFPPISVCLLDTSSSMKEGIQGEDKTGSKAFIPWGDQSKYHFALLGFFGITNFLANNNLLSRVGVNSVNFSSTSTLALGMQDSIRNLLTPQFGSTYIDVEKIRKAASVRGGVLFTISDGEVQNWDGIKSDFIQIARTQNFFHIQIGGESEMSKDLKSAGFNAYAVESGSELTRLMVDLTGKAYSKVVSDAQNF